MALLAHYTHECVYGHTWSMTPAFEAGLWRAQGTARTNSDYSCQIQTPISVCSTNTTKYQVTGLPTHHDSRPLEM